MAAGDEFGNDLDRRIAAAEARQRRPVANGESRAGAVGVEFAGAVLISGFIGWAIDRAAHTTPWAMVVLLLLGFCAGVRRAMQTSQQFGGDGADAATGESPDGTAPRAGDGDGAGDGAD